MGAYTRLVAGTAIVLGGLGCESLPTELAQFEGTFSYAALDSLGRAVAAGTLVLDVRADSGVAGSWRFTLVPGADSSASRWHAKGSGTLEGVIQGGQAFLNLDPGVADANHFLQVQLTSGGLGGDWGFDGFIGGSPGKVGTFTAVRR